MNDQESIDIFKELFVQPPEVSLLSADEALARLLVDQRLISSFQAEECLAIQEQQFESGRRPVSRLGELLLQRGILIPGPVSGAGE